MSVKNNKASSFWATLDLLVSGDWKKSRRETIDEVDEWVNSVVQKRQQRLPTSSSINLPHKSAHQHAVMNKKVKKSIAKLSRSCELSPIAVDVLTATDVQMINKDFNKNHLNNNDVATTSSSGYSSWTDNHSDVSAQPDAQIVDRNSDLMSEEEEEERPISPSPSLHGPKLLDFEMRIAKPHVRARLEHLMESSLVKISSRSYMQELEKRIREDFVEATEKRIKKRMEEESDRQKRLILTGQISFDKAPDTLWLHPVLLLNRYADRIVSDKRSKMSANCTQKIKTPKFDYMDPEPDPPTNLTIANGHVYNKENRNFISESYVERPIKDEISNGYMFTEKDYYKLFYINPLVLQMNALETTDELYSKAEEILGPLKGLSPP